MRLSGLPPLLRIARWAGVLLAAAFPVPGLATDDPPASPVDPPAENEEKKKTGEPKDASIFFEVTVTATNTPQDVFDVPNPVSVINRIEIERKLPNTATDLLLHLPGVDVNGVGPQQPRPIIRGQRGQRILVMADGIRLNNPRRQSDFGEIPSLIDTNGVETVEVVRGPGSVLYGSDAIGGVMNLLTQRPPGPDGPPLGGSVGLRYGSAGSLKAGALDLQGRSGKLGWLVRGFWREAEDYDAPAGSYGDITLDSDTPVLLTGIQDESLTLRLDYEVGASGTLFFGAEFYRAQDAGFGYVDPAAFSPGDPTVRLSYPDQEFDQYRAGYRASGLGWSLVDDVSVTGYYRDNQRRFEQQITIPFSPSFGLQLDNRNDTEVRTWGLRAEATKFAAPWSVLTYGIDYSDDESENSDLSKTSYYGFPFPIPPTISTTPSLPYATYRSFGVFLQDDVRLADWLSAIVGGRYQTVWAETKPTPGLEGERLYDSQDDAIVWATNFVARATDNLNVVATVGTAFRSPNLIERFFDGLTPEGIAYQRRNPDLEPEESFNVDLGLKYRRENVYFEIGGFRNRIRNGIRIAETSDTIVIGDEEFPVYQNQNVDELTYQGLELAFDWAITPALLVGLNYTKIDSENESTGDAIADTYSDKLNVMARYQDVRDRFWFEFNLRHQGDQKDIVIGENPIGDVFPAFTVIDLRAAVTLFRSDRMAHRLVGSLNNVTDELYAEFSNVSFFRPEPERNFVLQYQFRY